MKRMLLILVALVACLTLAMPVLAVPPGHDVSPPGYYLHSVTGNIQYFSHGHPGNPSQWTYMGPGGGPPSCGSQQCRQQAVAISFGNLGEISYRGFDLDGEGYLVPNGNIGAFYGGVTDSVVSSFAKGKRFAFAHTSLTESTYGDMGGFTTGPVRKGTAILAVGSYSITESAGLAIALNDGYWKRVGPPGRKHWVYIKCPKGTKIVLRGEAFQGTYGSTFSYGAYGQGLPGNEDFAPQAWANGSQVGTASYISFDAGSCFAYETASALAAGGTVLKAYTNADGTYSASFAATGGIGVIRGDIVKYQGSGSVAAGTFATNGSSGAATYGSASYNVNATGNGCMVAGGYATTFGHSSVTQNGNRTTVHSSQTSMAGTFKNGGGPQ